MASKAALLPCVNRNANQIIDHNGYGLLAYGAWGCIYVLDLRTPLPIILDSKVIRNGHRGKILSLSFCKSGSNQLLASVAEEMILKIWDLETASCIASLEVKESSQVVEWLYDSTNLVVFSEANGSVSKWNINTNNIVRIKTGSDRSITVMSSNQKRPELLAVGHSVGTISILNVNNHTYMRSLKAHSREIHGLSWSAVTPSKLLSSSLDQSARIWNLDEDKPVHTYYYPSSRYRDKFDDRKNSKICSMFHPENPDVIICSNVRSALGTVEFSENVAPKFSPFDVEEGEPNFKSIFQMLPFIDISGEDKHILLTCDPLKITLWNISDMKMVSSYYFIQGNIFGLSVSPINHNLLAVGVGDGFLKVLNLQSDEKLALTSVYINLRMKIMSIAWHPTEENIIAYGSDEGRVGIVDFSRRRNLYSFETHHSNCVYSLQWGPCSGIKDSEDTYFLYSCGGGCIFIHQLGKAKEKALPFDSVINIPANLEIDHKSYSELCWKSDYTILALGTFHGSLYLYDEKFNFLCQLSLQLKNLESLKWHPMHTYSSYSKESKYSSWFAAAGNDENIYIFDASEVLSERPEANICKPLKTLVGHKKRVAALCWSSHTDGHLISGARDGAVQVWNVITGTPIANYMCHRDHVYAVQWSVLDPDIVYSGGVDNCLRVWRISEQNQCEIPTKLVVLKHRPFRPRRRQSPDEKISPDELVSVEKYTAKSKIYTEASEISEAQPTTDNAKFRTRHFKSKADLLKEKGAKAGLFSSNIYSKEESFQNVFKLVDLLSDESDDSKQTTDKMTSEDLLNLGLFTDQFTVLKMLEAKGKVEEASGNKDKAACLQTMACNVNELLTEAAEKKELTDFLVSISPSVSHKFWLDICERYAVQLIEEQQFTKGSIYFMLCGKLYDALRILVERGKLLDALAIAKARLPENDPFIKSILHKVSCMYSSKKQIENEAACYVALKDPLHAAKIMYCAGDSKYAYASVYICSKFNLQEAAHEYAVLCVEKCLSQSDWLTFYKVAEMLESVKVYKVVVRIHELIFYHLKTLKKEEVIIGNNIFGVTGSKILIWSSKILENSNVFFLSHIYNVLKSEALLSEDQEVLQSIQQALNSLESRKSEAPAEAHVNVAIYVAQVLITSLLGDLSSATRYFMKIFPSTHNVVFIPKVICWIFYPLDVYWCSNKNAFLCEVKEMDTKLLPLSSNFQNTFNLLCDKFGCISDLKTEVLTICPDPTSGLDLAVQQVLAALSKKTTEDSLLLYFIAHYLSELRRLAKKGWKFRCYDSGITCTFDVENEKWLLHSDLVSIQGSVSKEDIQKLATQSKFLLAEKGASQSVPTITDVISSIFSREMDSNTKDGLVQNYGFKDVSEFLQKIMCDANLEDQHTGVKLSSEEKMNGETDLYKISSEDEDLHAQCWTDVGLFYVLTKSLFSAICRDEYALLYSLQKHLLGLDMKIAALARLQSASSSDQKSGSSEVNLLSNQKEETKDVKESEKFLASPEESISGSLTEDTKSSVPLMYKTDIINDNTTKKLENDADLIKNISEGGNSPVTLDSEQGYDGKNESDLTDFVLLTCGNNWSNADKSDTAEFTILNGKANMDNGHQSYTTPVIALNNADPDAVISTEKNSKEEINLKSDCSLPNKTDRIMSDESPALGTHVSVNTEEIEIGNVCDSKSGKTKSKNHNVIQDELQIQREQISEQIKLLTLEEFWYPDPFVSATDIKGICCDIFNKHPCALMKQKFHELAHEVDEWCSKFCFTDRSNFCEICKKVRT